MTRGLTDKQEKILNFIVEYVGDKGYPPSIREIGNNFGISSLRGVTVHLDALERKGFIKRASTSRSITVIGKTGSTSIPKMVAFVPLVGTIAAGIPITATENVEAQLPVPQEILVTPYAHTDATLALMRRAPVIPVLTIDNVATGLALARALVAGGLPVLEITLRTAQALDAIRAMRDEEIGRAHV